MRAIVTGASGFIGKQLCAALNRPKIFTRNISKLPAELSSLEAFEWDSMAGPAPAAAFEDVDVVFHLAGEPVAEGRWNAKKKAAIRESRSLGTRYLVAGMSALASKPKVLVSASAVGFYGSRGDEILTEKSSAAQDFLGDVCREWEAAAATAEEHGIRVAFIRIGLALGKSGGALGRMLPIFKMGAGGRLASGSQWMPWIHVNDLVRMFIFAAENDQVRGPLNGAAPNPVTNREFTTVLAKAVHRPAIFPAPAFALRLGIGEFAEVLLGSQRVMPEAALNAGFEFQYSDLSDALAEITG